MVVVIEVVVMVEVVEVVVFMEDSALAVMMSSKIILIDIFIIEDRSNQASKKSQKTYSQFGSLFLQRLQLNVVM